MSHLETAKRRKLKSLKDLRVNILRSQRTYWKKTWERCDWGFARFTKRCHPGCWKMGLVFQSSFFHTYIYIYISYLFFQEGIVHKIPTIDGWNDATPKGARLWNTLQPHPALQAVTSCQIDFQIFSLKKMVFLRHGYANMLMNHECIFARRKQHLWQCIEVDWAWCCRIRRHSKRAISRTQRFRDSHF